MIPDELIQQLQSNPKQHTALKLSDCQLSVKDVQLLLWYLKDNSTIETLDISKNRFLDEDLGVAIGELITNCHRLKELSLAGSFFSNKTIEHIIQVLMKNRSIVNLNLSNITPKKESNFYFNGKDLKLLLENQTIETLNLSGTLHTSHYFSGPDDSFFAALTRNRGLKSLVLDRCDLRSIASNVINALTINQHIQHISMVDSGISCQDFHFDTEAVSQFCSFLANRYNLKTFAWGSRDVYSCSDPYAKISKAYSRIAQTIHEHPQLESIELNGVKGKKDEGSLKSIQYALNRNIKLNACIQPFLNNENGWPQASICEEAIDLFEQYTLCEAFPMTHFFNECWRLLKGLHYFIQMNHRTSLCFLLPLFTHDGLKPTVERLIREVLILNDPRDLFGAFHEDTQVYYGTYYKLLLYYSRQVKDHPFYRIGLLGSAQPGNRIPPGHLTDDDIRTLSGADVLLNLEDIRMLVTASMDFFGDVYSKERDQSYHCTEICEKLLTELNKFTCSEHDRFQMTEKSLQLGSLKAYFLKPLDEAISNLIALRRDEFDLLRVFNNSKNHHSSILKYLWKSGVFLQQLKKNYPYQRRFRLLEDFIENPSFNLSSDHIFIMPDDLDQLEPITPTDVVSFKNDLSRHFRSRLVKACKLFLKVMNQPTPTEEMQIEAIKKALQQKYQDTFLSMQPYLFSSVLYRLTSYLEFLSPRLTISLMQQQFPRALASVDDLVEVKLNVFLNRPTDFPIA